jgi:hypothetical protein
MERFRHCIIHQYVHGVTDRNTERKCVRLIACICGSTTVYIISVNIVPGITENPIYIQQHSSKYIHELFRDSDCDTVFFLHAKFITLHKIQIAESHRGAQIVLINYDARILPHYTVAQTCRLSDIR